MTKTPAFVVEMFANGSARYTPAAWNSKQAGRPTEANLASYVKIFEASCQPGGCNAHLGERVIVSAQVRRNDGSKQLVASYAIAG